MLVCVCACLTSLFSHCSTPPHRLTPLLRLCSVAALSAHNAKGAWFKDINAVRLGGAAIFGFTAPQLYVTRMHAIGLGAGGVTVFKSASAVVNNSYIVGYGLRIPAGEGISVKSSPFAIVSHNDISGGFYNGLAGDLSNDSGPYTRFEYNKVYDIGHSLTGDTSICDYGGIHVGVRVSST